MPPDSTPTEQRSSELSSAVGRILFEQVNGGDVGQVLAGFDVPLLRQLEVHVLIFDRPMRDWLEKLGLPEIRDEDCFWTGMVLPIITEELEKKDRKPN